MAREAGALTGGAGQRYRRARSPRRATSCCRSAPGRSAASPRQRLCRQPRRAAAARRRLGRGPPPRGRLERCRSGSRAPAISTGAPRSTRSPRRRACRDRPRPDPGDRPRGGAEAEGGRQSARRGVQRRRIPARPVALVGARYPILVLMPTDAAAAGMRRWSATSPARARRCSRLPRRRAAGARPRPSGNRRGLPDPGLLCDDCRRSRRGSTSTRTGRATCRRSRRTGAR